MDNYDIWSNALCGCGLFAQFKYNEDSNVKLLFNVLEYLGLKEIILYEKIRYVRIFDF